MQTTITFTSIHTCGHTSTHTLSAAGDVPVSTHHIYNSFPCERFECASTDAAWFLEPAQNAPYTDDDHRSVARLGALLTMALDHLARLDPDISPSTAPRHDTLESRLATPMLAQLERMYAFHCTRAPRAFFRFAEAQAHLALAALDTSVAALQKTPSELLFHIPSPRTNSSRSFGTELRVLSAAGAAGRAILAAPLSAQALRAAHALLGHSAAAAEKQLESGVVLPAAAVRAKSAGAFPLLLRSPRTGKTPRSAPLYLAGSSALEVALAPLDRWLAREERAFRHEQARRPKAPPKRKLSIATVPCSRAAKRVC